MTLLHGRRYLVEAHGIAAGYTAWLLRHLGATVECESALDPEAMGAFLTPADTQAAEPALAASPGDVLITDAPLTPANESRLEAAADSATVIWITPWGRDNEWSHRPDTDLLLYAASGWMSAVGDPGEEPLAPPGAQARFTAGLCAAVAALADEAGSPHEAGIIDVPVIEALVSTLIYDPISFQYYGNVRARAANRYSANQPTITTLRCKDGWIGLHAALHWQWLTLCELIGHPELVSDPRFASPTDRAKNITDLDSYLLPWLGERTRWQVFHELQRARIPCSASPTIAEVLASPQLKTRNSWEHRETPSGAKFRVPGTPFRSRDTTAPAASPPRTGRGPWKPDALRVVDLSMGWAGPLAGHVLAALGADVIKVESHTHFDWWRGSRPPGDGDGLGLHERSHVFNAVNRGKRGITINLATARGNEIARDLIRDADVVIENFGAGIIERLGLTYESLSAENPALIMLRQPGFGSDGPEAGYVAFGNTIEGMSGLTALVGYDNDGPPYMLSNALGDPVSGFTGAAAILAALHARRDDGRGRLVECAQLEGFLPFISEALLEYQRTGEQPARAGNRRPGHTPSGAYRCAGEDPWLAIEIRTDAEWAALANLINEPWALDDALRSESGRANSPGMQSNLANWFAARARDSTVEHLLAAGIAAAPVLDEPGVLALEPLAATGYWFGEDREPVGFHFYPSLPIIAGGAHLNAEGPAPHLGQHTEEVLTAMGFGEGELEHLRDGGITGREPARAR
jgi:crotonobetainyl-CoA:carnitine CoA-transferase CaiB-like acyl-CoA transferase